MNAANSSLAFIGYTGEYASSRLTVGVSRRADLYIKRPRVKRVNERRDGTKYARESTWFRILYRDATKSSACRHISRAHHAKSQLIKTDMNSWTRHRFISPD